MAEKEQKTRAYQYKNKEIPARVQAYIQEHRMFERGETVITGISGGADSVCLFFHFALSAGRIGGEARGGACQSWDPRRGCRCG